MLQVSPERRGGYILKQARKARKLRQQDIEDMTQGEVTTSTVSRLEAGLVAEPSMRLLCLLGRIYEMTPNTVAEVFDYWHNPVPNDRDVQRVLAKVANLDAQYQHVFYTWMESAAQILTIQQSQETANA